MTGSVELLRLLPQRTQTNHYQSSTTFYNLESQQLNLRYYLTDFELIDSKSTKLSRFCIKNNSKNQSLSTDQVKKSIVNKARREKHFNTSTLSRKATVKFKNVFDLI